MRLGIDVSILTLFMLSLCSCQRESNSINSAMIIAVEGLSGSSFSCHPFEESERSGFQILCNEAVRFTHAYTTSPMTQAGLGSLLTGEAPLANGLRDNGHTFLPARIKTLPEDLFKQGVNTLFIASAPTVKRYSRLHQGFENFHDDYEFNNKIFYRPIADSMQIIKNWMATEVKDHSYFSVIHVSDLLFPQVITQTELLEPRPRGIDGQLEEIDENLFSLFTYFKKNKLWDKTYIILTGLNGITNLSRLYELPGTNLYSENVSIPLFIKPPKGREEIPHQWKVDSHVSLQDVGATLYKIFNSQHQPESPPIEPILKGISLLPLIKGKSDPRFINKSLLIESSWGTWFSNTSPRYSVRNDQWLVIFDKKPLIYNTVSDRNEFNKISTKDSSYKTILNRFEEYIDRIEKVPFEKIDTSLNDEILFSQYMLENEGNGRIDVLNDFQPQLQNSTVSENLQFLLIDQLLRQKNWNEIEKLNLFWNNFVLNQIINLKQNIFLSLNDTDPCLVLFNFPEDPDNNTNIQRVCDNKNFTVLADFLKGSVEKSDSLADQIVTIIRNYDLQLKIIYFDLAKGGVVLGANTTKLQEIITYKLILSLPQFQKELQPIERKVNSY